MSKTQELSTELGTALPDSLHGLDEEHAHHLLESVRQARAAQAVALDEAITAALGHVPRPLRGAVRKAIGL